LHLSLVGKYFYDNQLIPLFELKPNPRKMKQVNYNHGQDTNIMMSDIITAFFSDIYVPGKRRCRIMIRDWGDDMKYIRQQRKIKERKENAARAMQDWFTSEKGKSTNLFPNTTPVRRTTHNASNTTKSINHEENIVQYSPVFHEKEVPISVKSRNATDIMKSIPTKNERNNGQDNALVYKNEAPFHITIRKPRNNDQFIAHNPIVDKEKAPVRISIPKAESKNVQIINNEIPIPHNPIMIVDDLRVKNNSIIEDVMDFEIERTSKIVTHDPMIIDEDTIIQDDMDFEIEQTSKMFPIVKQDHMVQDMIIDNVPSNNISFSTTKELDNVQDMMIDSDTTTNIPNVLFPNKGNTFPTNMIFSIQNEIDNVQDMILDDDKFTMYPNNKTSISLVHHQDGVQDMMIDYEMTNSTSNLYSRGDNIPSLDHRWGYPLRESTQWCHHLQDMFQRCCTVSGC
jgi:hypothetical protein